MTDKMMDTFLPSDKHFPHMCLFRASSKTKWFTEVFEIKFLIKKIDKIKNEINFSDITVKNHRWTHHDAEQNNFR